MPRAEREGYSIYYEIHGQGHPLLLIRGFGSNLEHWYEQVPAFSPHYQVIVFDNQGIGRSSDSGAPRSIQDMATDAVAVLDAAGAKRSHVLGLSMGGMIAQEVVLGWPDRVAGLVLCATHCGGKHKTNPTRETNELFKKLVSGKTREEQMEGRKALFSPQTLEGRPEVLARYTEAAAAYEAPAEVMNQQYQAILGFDSYDRLPEIACPTLSLGGAEDRLIPPANAELLAERIPGAKLVIVPEAGHQLLIEQPQAANGAVLDFLKGLT
ncbi:MAG: alpha/beta hydrolase [Desulfarculaceae bacterium]|nr:alpha/beta hydrolase [Desulfarculaceae bacterium]MCF8074355.1 alpha/beta hydrolase [Desulfarculaceae bacterium]MCF8103545.1 alpha/beta hydrolase [Desulfarculaceae bacterium]MCF8117312.1 alpha/beta hydrolase [Desulfarculaceae bacterium]